MQRPDSFTGYSNLGGVYVLQGNYAAAIPLRKQSFSIRPTVVQPVRALPVAIWGLLYRATSTTDLPGIRAFAVADYLESDEEKFSCATRAAFLAKS